MTDVTPDYEQVDPETNIVKSVYGDKTETYIRIFIFTLAAIVAGYIISDWPPQILNRFNSPFFQMTIIMVIVSSFCQINSENWRAIIVDVLIITAAVFVTLNSLKSILI
jgi:hypothetical protein